jgi:hypothetical protein
MNCIDMPRKPKTYKLDQRLISALDSLAESAEESVGSYVERILWRYCQGMGAIDPKAEPSSDKRGGKREGAGRKATPSAGPLEQQEGPVEAGEDAIDG